MRSSTRCSAVGIVLLALVTAAACRDEPANSAKPSAAEGPPARQGTTDELVTDRVQSAYFRDPDVNGRAVDVSAAGGVVTLTGVVATERQRQKAVSVARSVDGVSRVEDRLTVEANAPGRSALGWPVTGNAGYVPHVPPPAGTAVDRSSGDGSPRAPLNTNWITTQIQSRYYADESLRAHNVDVATSSDGTVHLSGQVDSEVARRRAVEIARAAEGVRNVDDRLRVARQSTNAAHGTGMSPTVEGGPALGAGTSAQPVEDLWITTKVNSKYFADPDVSGMAVDVDTDQGVVTLQGDVDSEAARRRAIALARNTDGVREVVDKLSVSTDAAGRTAAGRGDTANAAARLDDGWITTKIQAKYFLDPDVKGRAVNVETANGVVTLTGTLESDAAKKSAELTAVQTEGVRRVINRLEVVPSTGQ